MVLGGYLTYGVGSAIATGIAAAPDYLSSVSASTLFTASAVWMLLNSALVIGIGALMLPILRPHNKNIALGYFATRVFEGIILAVGESRQHIAAIMEEDPFCRHGLADVRIVEFRASQHAQDIQARIAKS